MCEIIGQDSENYCRASLPHFLAWIWPLQGQGHKPSLLKDPMVTMGVSDGCSDGGRYEGPGGPGMKQWDGVSTQAVLRVLNITNNDGFSAEGPTAGSPPRPGE
jgi:hypothetical protein